MKRINRLLMVLFFASCSNRTGIPKDIIPLDSMSKIMKDIILADEYSNVYLVKDSLQKDKMLANEQLLDGIFKIHRISRQDFQTSLKFYESRPDLNKNIFDSLSSWANRHKTDIYLPRKIKLPGQAIAK